MWMLGTEYAVLLTTVWLKSIDTISYHILLEERILAARDASAVIDMFQANRFLWSLMQLAILSVRSSYLTVRFVLIIGRSFHPSTCHKTLRIGNLVDRAILQS